MILLLKARSLIRHQALTNRLPEGTAVNLVISKGAKPAAAVKVPDLTKSHQAESALAAVWPQKQKW